MVARLESVADENIHLSAVTLGEIQIGIEMTREQRLSALSERQMEVFAARIRSLGLSVKVSA